MKRLRITVAGTVYDVTVEALDEGQVAAAARPPPTRAPVASAAVATPAASTPRAPAASAPAGGDGAGIVVSPLAGKVVSIEAQVGASVQAGATVIVLEAMKMNTVIGAAAAGRVAEVFVKPGDSVEEGQPLLRID